MMQSLELANKDFKTAIIKIFKDIKEKMAIMIKNRGMILIRKLNIIIPK